MVGAGRIVNKSENIQQKESVQSYVEIAKGKKCKKVWQKKGATTVSDTWRGMNLEVKEEEMAWLQKCYVGVVQNSDTIYLLQDRLIEEGISNFSIIPTGGDMVLIKPVEGVDFEGFIKDSDEVLETWFRDIRQWSQGEVAREREAWIRCQGVPIHGWSIKLFEMLAGSLGKFISVDESTLNNKSFDVGRFLIRTSSWEVVNRLVKIRINGMFFNIRLLEEPFQEFGCGRKHGTEVDIDSSCSSDSLDFSKLSMGSIVGDSIGSLDNFDHHNMFEDDEVRGDIHKDDDCCGVTIEERQAERGRPTLKEVPENINVEGPACEANRILTSVDKSADLIVDLGLDPLSNLNLGPVLTRREHSGCSDSISCWPNSDEIGPVVGRNLEQPILLSKQGAGKEQEQNVDNAELQHKSTSSTHRAWVFIEGGFEIKPQRKKTSKEEGGTNP